jgi:aquaporin Z
MQRHSLRAWAAEFIGVFTLCFIGMLAIGGPAAVGIPGQSTLLGVALAHGLALVVMIGALAAASGAHFNPAVTLALLLLRRIAPGPALGYVLAQLAGGLGASLLLLALFGRALVLRGTPVLANGIPPLQAVVLEVIATFLLALVIIGSAVSRRAPQGMFPLLIGLTVTAEILAIGPLTGAAMNPARAFGPALASWHWDNQWVYWAGPLLGGLLAAFVGRWFLHEEEQEPAEPAGS